MARRRLLLSAAACALAFSAAPAAAETCPGADTTISAVTLSSARAAVLCIVNAERTARGLNALARDDTLELAAQRHSQDMLARNFFDHVNPDGDDPGERITAAGYEWSSYGENIAAGYRTPRKVMEGWMKSEGHCLNVLNPSVTELGVGVTALAATLPGAAGTWTQNFGRPLRTPAPGRDDAPRRGCPYAQLEGLDGTAAAGPGEGGGPGVDGTTPAGQAPAESDVPDLSGTPDPAGAALTLATLRRVGRRLVLSGASTATTVRVVIRHGRTTFRRTLPVREGRYRLRLRGIPRRGRMVVRVSGGGQRITRITR